MFVNSLHIYKVIFMVELLIAEFLFAFRLKRRDKFVLRYIGTIVICLLTVALFPVPFFNALYSSFMFLVLFMLSTALMCFCYRASFFQIIFCALAAYTVRHLAFQIFGLTLTAVEGTNVAVNGIYANNPVDGFVLDEWFLFTTLLYLDVYFAVYAVLFAVFGKKLGKDKDLELQKTHLFVLVVVLLIVDIVLNAIAVYNDVDNLINSLILSIYNIICCALTLFLQYSMMDIKQLKNELDIITHLWHQEREQYELSKENVALINRKCHDLKYLIRDIAEGKSLVPIEEIDDMVSIYDAAVATGNEALDVTLAEKSLLCRKNNINMTYMADGLQMRFIDEADIYILFGNLVDNAIEASAKLADEKKRFIGLNIRVAGGFLAISINNYFDGKVKFDRSGLPQTTKQDGSLHGFGFKSIAAIVEKYGGDINITTDEDIFGVDIVIPIPQKA